MRPTYRGSPTAPSTRAFAINPADADLSRAARGIYVGTTGTLVVTQSDHKSYDFAPTAVSVANNTISLGANHGLVNGQEVILTNSGGGLPTKATATALTSGAVYFVRDADQSAGTIKLAATLGGSALDLDGAGTGTHTIREAVQILNAAVGYHPLECTRVWAATTAANLRGM